MQIEGGLFEENTSPVVSFQSNLDLKGLEHFGKLLQAILTRRVLKLSYTPYGKETLLWRRHRGLAPASFRDKIAEKIKVMNQLYSKDKDE